MSSTVLNNVSRILTELRSAWRQGLMIAIAPVVHLWRLPAPEATLETTRCCGQIRSMPKFRYAILREPIDIYIVSHNTSISHAPPVDTALGLPVGSVLP